MSRKESVSCDLCREPMARAAPETTWVFKNVAGESYIIDVCQKCFIETVPSPQNSKIPFCKKLFTKRKDLVWRAE